MRESGTNPSGPPSTRRLYAYRPALDGLRAIAVLPVMFYHGDVALMSGGFLGVDLFFVISGYLITTLLLREREANASIRLAAFWGRRARRLFPALFVCLAAVLAYGLVASQAEVARLRGDALSTLAYVSNWWFAFSGESYFDQFTRASMLRHTWSLAIEEQFYIVWPLVLFFGLRRAGGRAGLWAAACGASALVSAAWMAWLFDPEVDPSRVYYGTDTRAQALLVGAVLAFLLDRNAVRAKSPRFDGVAIAGLVACCAFFFIAADDAAWMYRGGYLAMAIVSACAIAGVVEGDARRPVARFLSLEALVWVGARSYGLYLWHWPVFIALDGERLGLEEAGWPLLVVRFAVTFVIAAVSYRWLEAPIRGRRLSPRTERVALVASPLVIIAGVAFVTGGLVPRFDDQKVGATRGALFRPPEIDPDALRILVVGDSVATALASQVPSHSQAGTPLAIHQSTSLGCGIVQGDVRLEGGWFPGIERCNDWPRNWKRTSEFFEPDAAVILIGAWEVFDRRRNGKLISVGSPRFAAHLEKRLELGLFMLGGRERPVFLLTVPCYNARLTGHLAKWRDRNDPTRRDAVNAVLRKFADERPKTVRLLDLQGLVCPTGEYEATLDGIELHRDGVHYTEQGSHRVWEWLLPFIEEAVARRAEEQGREDAP